MWCSNLNLLIFISILCIIFAPNANSVSRNLFVQKLENCKGFENAPLYWSNVTLGRDPTTKNFTFSLKLKVLKEVSTKFGMEFNIWKCDATGSLDSCEYFLKEFRNDNICYFIKKKGQLWSVFVEHFEPPLVCPIKAGIYHTRNMPIKSDFFKFLPLQEAIWRARLKGFDQGEVISCVDVDIKIAPQRKG